MTSPYVSPPQSPALTGSDGSSLPPSISKITLPPSISKIDQGSATALYSQTWAKERCDNGAAYWGTMRNNFLVAMIGSIMATVIFHFVGTQVSGGNYGFYFDLAALPFGLSVLVTAALASVSAYRKFWFKKEETEKYFTRLCSAYSKDTRRAEAEYRADNFKKVKRGLLITGIALAILGAATFLIANMTWVQEHVLSIKDPHSCTQGSDFGVAVMGVALAFLGGYALSERRRRYWLKKSTEMSTGPFEKMDLKNLDSEIAAHLKSIIALFNEGTQTPGPRAIVYDLERLSLLFDNVQLQGQIEVNVEKNDHSYTISRGTLSVTLTEEAIRLGNFSNNRQMINDLLKAEQA